MRVLVAALCLVALTLTETGAQKDPNAVPGHTGIVHLFEWTFASIAAECEQFLGPRGYAGVQTSPIVENLILPNRPWYERYQSVSYKIIGRSGDEEGFKDMTRRCNDAGVRIYVDITPNHMTSSSGVGTGGTPCNSDTKDYPGVPYSAADFHESCEIQDYNNASQMRTCELSGLKDLNQGLEYVREKIVEYMNHFVDLGVAGFRIDAAKHIWPQDLAVIYSRVKDLNTDYGFKAGARAYYAQEVVDYGADLISRDEYTDFGAITEFRYGAELSNCFRGNNPIKYLQNFGAEWDFGADGDVLVFVDNHDNQRLNDGIMLTHMDSKLYKMAVGFMLAWPYGYPRVMSSYYFSEYSQGPPADSNQNILGPDVQPDGSCGNGWVCEHRWREIASMVGFRNVVEGGAVNNWWDNGDKQIAFCRGDKGFVAFNDGNGDLKQTLQTCLPAGTYCDVISGDLVNGACTGKVVEVGGDGTAYIEIGADAFEGVLAIHAQSRTRD